MTPNVVSFTGAYSYAIRSLLFCNYMLTFAYKLKKIILMKIVTYDIAKAIRDAGYPQCRTAMAYNQHGVLCNGRKADANIDAPFYYAVWEWLWEEKGICVEIKNNTYYAIAIVKNQRFHEDTPEEVIASALEYLVANNVI